MSAISRLDSVNLPVETSLPEPAWDLRDKCPSTLHVSVSFRMHTSVHVYLPMEAPGLGMK